MATQHKVLKAIGYWGGDATENPKGFHQRRSGEDQCHQIPCASPAGEDVWQFLMKLATSGAFDQCFHP